MNPPTSITDQLIRDEGIRLKPYKDTVGKLTIGVGRNLDDRGISVEEAKYLLNNDIALVDKQLTQHLPWVANIDPVRYCVLVNMAFNMGIDGLLKFKQFLINVQDTHYELASIEMLNSKWAKQVGERAKRLSQQMLTGQWQ